MRLKHALGGIAFSLLGVTGAWAADGKSAGKDKALRNEAVIVMHQFATCVASRRPDEARALLATDFGTEEYSKGIRKLAQTSACLNDGRLQFGGVLLAGGMAERLYEMDYGKRDVSTILPADWSVAPIAARSDLEMTALCVVQKDPRSVRAVLETVPVTDGEVAAFKTLGDTITGCIKAGSTVRFNRPMLRSLMALGLYRSANHFSAVALPAAPKTGS